ncbi:hypothetical protein LJR118_006719 [Acidovorax sp. LjRoot118]|uniref:deazapurine DNA modification protein DpdA family protein n=1 Tax=Acidovorax sp. LjRoot118 TaxID=3342256 RepID=UPI003ED0E1E5
MSNVPMGQINAQVKDGLLVRVGIPHKGGKLAFHAFNEGYSAMVSANAFWNPKKGEFAVPEASDLYEVPFALDSAGFVAVSLYQAKGRQPGIAGVFPWTFHQYIELAGLLRPEWFSQPDLCAEPQLAASPTEVDYRVRATATLLEGTLRIIYAWQNELAKTCSNDTVASMLPPPVPILQGWSTSDYQRSLDLLLQVWQRWEPWLAPPRLIGLGSVCRRDLHHPEHGLYAVLRSLDGKLPAASKVHLFGVKGAALQEVQKLGWVGSVDSMSWDFAARVKARSAGHSNTFSHRTKEMTRWMSAAAARVMQTKGSQLPLRLSA